MGRFFSFWRNLVHRNRVEHDLDEELRTTFELLVDEKVSSGMPPADARRAAQLELGGLESLKEQVRDSRAGAGVDVLLQDLRYALRQLRRAPGFTTVAVLTLALGIGANTAIFSIVNGVILRPLGYSRPGQLLFLTTQFSGGSAQFAVSPPEYLEFREINQSFSAVGAYRTGEVDLTGADRPQRVRAAFVDEHLLDALALQAAQGRLFARGETDV